MLWKIPERGRKMPIKHIFRCTGDLWTGTFVKPLSKKDSVFVSDLLREAKVNDWMKLFQQRG